MSASITIDEINTSLPDNFYIQDHIAEGGQGAVFKGTYGDSVSAIKIIDPLITEDKRVKREIDFLKTVDHSSIIKVMGADQVVLRGTTYQVIAYDYLSEGNLEEYMSSLSSPTSLRDILKLGFDISSAVETMWSAKERVVHRDIKPLNIMKGNENGWVLVDFAFARHIDLSNLTAMGSPGTNGFKSPEQAMGRKNLTFKSDVFSLGVTLFLFCTGEHPYKGTQPIPATSITLDINSLRPDLPIELRKLILRMLENTPSLRPSKLADEFTLLGGENASS